MKKLFPAVVTWLTFLALPLSFAIADPETGQDRNNPKCMPALQSYLSDRYGIYLYGFLEARNGWRLQNDPYEKEASISEMRLQLDLNKDLGWGAFKLKGDLGGDLVTEEGITELREANLLFSPHDIVDVKLGRQVLTWGTGDLIFINDLFPKDWESFFIGRDDEYLKAPSDAAKAGLFFDGFNLDFVYTPEFNNSVYIDGTRISYWNDIQRKTAGRDFIFTDHERNSFGRDSEYAVRLSKTINGKELAFYGYNGYWKTPEGVDPLAMKLIYPKMSAYGASIRGALFGGIGNIELGYYDSRDDQSGENQFIRNSEFRFLTGYERELGHDFTGAFQYYVEVIQDYGRYIQTIRSSSPGAPEDDEYRHLLTMRLTKFLLNQNLKLSLFTYYSPSDKDAYLRPKVHYKITDQWAAEVGGNIFFGSDDHTFFGQFDRNTNIYAGLRLSF